MLDKELYVYRVGNKVTHVITSDEWDVSSIDMRNGIFAIAREDRVEVRDANTMSLKTQIVFGGYLKGLRIVGMKSQIR